MSDIIELNITQIKTHHVGINAEKILQHKRLTMVLLLMGMSGVMERE
jgi:hypothetical protein